MEANKNDPCQEQPHENWTALLKAVAAGLVVFAVTAAVFASLVTVLLGTAD